MVITIQLSTLERILAPLTGTLRRDDGLVGLLILASAADRAYEALADRGIPADVRDAVTAAIREGD